MNEIMDSLIFDRAQVDLDNLTKKAYIDFNDLNRIERMVKWISHLLNKNGYRNQTANKLNWKMGDFRTEQDMIRLKRNIEAVRAAYYTPENTMPTPERITYTSIYQANVIEKILFDLGELVEAIRPGNNHLAFRLGMRAVGNRSEL